MNPDNTLVIGGGPTGLAFAARFGSGAIVLEKSMEVGGISRSIEIEDGVFDIGGHSFHTPHENVRALVLDLMGNNWSTQARDARVWFSGQLIPYPFQRHFEKLSEAHIVDDCRGFQPDPELLSQSENFEEWISRRFGEGVARHFMLPYNRKLWAHDLREMSCEWVGERVATDTDKSAGSSNAAPARKPLQSDSHIAYPLNGGFGEIFRTLAAHCPAIERSEKVVHIDLDKRTVHTASGKIRPWQRIVSTMPLPELLASLSDCPPPLIAAAARLKYVSLKILLLLVKLRNQEVPQRIYVADPLVPPHKIAFNHTSSPNLRTRTHHAMMCEVSYSAHKPAPADDLLFERMENWLVSEGYIGSRADVRARQIIDLPYGYPVYSHERQRILSEIMPYLNERDIFSIGRFGAWDYANSDECIRQGLALADRFLTP